MVAAPVAVGANAEKMYVGVMLQRDPQTQRLYLHDAVAEKEPASQLESELDSALVKLLCSLTPTELAQVQGFAAALIAARKA